MPFFLAFNAPSADREPDNDEYSKLLSQTAPYFETRIRDILTMDFPGVGYGAAGDMTIGSSVDSKRYEAGIPEERFNIYLEFESGFFGSCSTASLSKSQLFEILQRVDLIDYIVSVTKSASLVSTPFESTTEVVLGAV